MQSIQGKQESLLRRLDEIDTENDELRTEINELEESKEKLQEQLETAKDEKRKMVEKQRESQVSFFGPYFECSSICHFLPCPKVFLPAGKNLVKSSVITTHGKNITTLP